MCNPNIPKPPKPVKPPSAVGESAVLQPLSYDQLQRRDVLRGAGFLDAIRKAIVIKSQNSEQLAAAPNLNVYPKRPIADGPAPGDQGGIVGEWMREKQAKLDLKYYTQFPNAPGGVKYWNKHGKPQDPTKG